MTETIKTLTEQSNNAVANYKSEQERLQAEQTELRKKAFLKILAYLREIKDVGFIGTLEFENLYLYWLCNPSDKKKNVSRFYFDQDSISIYESSYGSSLNREFDDDDKWLYKAVWEDLDMKYLIKRLVTNWATIKPILESKLQECLVTRMSKEEKQRDSIQQLNDLYSNFEV